MNWCCNINYQIFVWIAYCMKLPLRQLPVIDEIENIYLNETASCVIQVWYLYLSPVENVDCSTTVLRIFYVICVTTFGTILAGKCIMCRSAGFKCFGPKECSRFALGWFSNAQQPPGPSRYGTPCYCCSCNYSSKRHVIKQVNWTELVYFLTVNN